MPGGRDLRAWMERLEGLEPQGGLAAGIEHFTLALPVEREARDPARLAADGWFMETGGSAPGWRLGIGEAVRLQASGADRLARLGARWARLRRTWHALRAGGARPAVFSGFAFAPGPAHEAWEGFPEACCILPRVELWQGSGRSVLFLSAARREWMAGPAAVRDRWRRALGRLIHCFEPARGGAGFSGTVERRPGFAQWSARVHEALEALRAGGLGKLVLSRQECWRGPGLHPDIQPLTAFAEGGRGGAFYAVRRGGALLVGRSPERLVEVTRSEVISEAVAGTALAPGKDLAQPRLVAEHAWVVEAVEAALRRALATPVRRGALAVRRVGGLVHRCQRLTARRAAGAGPTPLELAAALHPTPAVAGHPGPEAMAWLRRHGEADRGWYSGGIGWMDAEGLGVFHVVLRCALLRPGQARLFAGAGLVTGSRAGVEWRETEWKLRQAAGLLELQEEPAWAAG